ncbi:heterocycloanthracin/sonorensin family bacteriocin [Bacillus sp. SD075]|uniref:heterocycloanthracin/sonorensin family bacteriocin n=1 Tax=Bacillus sp. SD075 TaxID=2781732 RepID=UPI001A97666A|nr:heterocycloanthracin/sonorensin family bacteriocin [Bacillus sp. SD075]MBO0998060.1 heterocycloanthracin/sonorensin family bacteriocin [Bacillus sp. SD075]
MNEFQNQLQMLNVDDFQVSQPVPWEQVPQQYSMEDSRLIGLGCFGCFLCFGCFGCGGCGGRCGGCGGRCGGCGGRCGRCGR